MRGANAAGRGCGRGMWRSAAPCAEQAALSLCPIVPRPSFCKALRAFLKARTKASFPYNPVVPSREAEKLAGDVFLQGWLCLAGWPWPLAVSLACHCTVQMPMGHSSNAQC